MPEHSHVSNPFEYEAASSLDPKRLSEWFIDDHNYARFINSRRNIILDGDRGSGKSMILIYYSIEHELTRAGNNTSDCFGNVGIYIPSNNPLLQRSDHHALPNIKRNIISERYLIYTIATAIAKNLQSLSPRLSDEEKSEILDELRYLMPSESLIDITDPFTYIRRHIRQKLKEDQECLACGLDFKYDFESSSFYVLIMPILEALRSCEIFRNSHFSLLIDDGHMLDEYQQTIVNSWLGFRDHSLFSLKVAIAGARNYNRITAYGGTILEGHDYTYIDLYRPFQNLGSEYGAFARKVVEVRLRQAGISTKAVEFFPPSEALTKDLEKSKAKAEQLAVSRGISPSDKKSFNDFRYKFGRAIYFRDRSKRANKPPYAGFETINHLSTGVLRNMLNLCYNMFDRQLSYTKAGLPKLIPPDIQTEVIKEESDKHWKFIRDELHRSIKNCTPDDAAKIEKLFKRLAEYFRDRLMNHNSEPRVLVFIISAFDRQRDAELLRLLELSEEAQLLYVRAGTAKSGGGRENYYVLNRMLFPAYGLDVQGQHGRASLKAEDLLAAAVNDRQLPLIVDDTDASPEQWELFDV